MVYIHSICHTLVCKAMEDGPDHYKACLFRLHVVGSLIMMNKEVILAT